MVAFFTGGWYQFSPLLKFRPMKKEAWVSVAEIYRQGIETRNATFETEIPTWVKLDSTNLKSCRIVATWDNLIVA